MRFQVGDIVRVREGLKHNEWYDGIRFNASMNDYLGAELQVSAVYGSFYHLSCADPKYKDIQHDGWGISSWVWSDSMLDYAFTCHTPTDEQIQLLFS